MGGGHQAVLEVCVALLAEPAGDDLGERDVAGRGGEEVRHPFGADGDVGVVDGLRCLAEARIGRQFLDMRGLRVDRVDGAGVAERLHPADEGVADGRLRRRGTDHRHRPRSEQRAEAFECRQVVARPVRAPLHGVGGRAQNHARVDRHRTASGGDHRVHVDLGDPVLAQHEPVLAADGEQGIDDGVARDRGRSAHTIEQGRALELVEHRGGLRPVDGA